MWCYLCRHRLKNLPINAFSVGMLVSFNAIAAPGSPLFEEEFGVLAFGLRLDLKDPFFAHGTGFWAAFSADDNPVDVLQVKFTEAFNEGFAGKESNGGRQGAKGHFSFDEFYVFIQSKHVVCM